MVMFPGALRRSLRSRLLAGTLAWILLSVLAAGWGLTDLFRQHVTQQFAATLDVHLNQLMAAFNLDAQGAPDVSPALSDPRFERPLSGLYWQVDRLTPGGAPVAGILQSRSLWDQTLVLPAATPVTGQRHHAEMIGPDDEPLMVTVRTIHPADGETAFRLMIAADQRPLAQSMQQFQSMLAVSLGILAVGLTLAAVMQVWDRK